MNEDVSVAKDLLPLKERVERLKSKLPYVKKRGYSLKKYNREIEDLANDDQLYFLMTRAESLKEEFNNFGQKIWK